MTDDLATCRQRIDELDAQLIDLLNQRAEVVLRVGHAKRGDDSAIFVPHREKQVFDRLARYNRGPLSNDSLRAIWREIMSASLALEKPLTICHFAQPGSFTHMAARLKFGQSVAYTPVESHAEVFAEVERGHADYGVVPIENSTDGGITDTIDCFLTTRLRIVNEMSMRIRHHLMARCPPDEIRRIYSKHTVFGQCHRWLSAHMPRAELIETGSTTQAAERAAAEPGSAAIGNKEAAHAFELSLIAQDIEDNTTNTTRFLVLADPKRAAEPTGDDKTSIMFGVQDRPGALYEALIPFHAAAVSLSRIESRPSKRQPWEYLFFIDILAHEKDPRVRDCLAELARCTSVLQVLGSYPRSSAPLND